jgi:AcrR family transcriptional regulator
MLTMIVLPERKSREMAKRPIVESWGRRDPEARRAKVLMEATRLFAAQGYEATSVNDVAAQAGVSVGALYKYFPDKPALLEGVLSHIEAEFVVGMSQVRAMEGSHFKRLHLMVLGLFAMAAERPYFFWALSSGTHALRGARVFTPGKLVKEEIAQFIQSGIYAGEFRCMDVGLLAVLGYGIVETAMKQCFGPEEQGTRREQWMAVVEEVLARAVS